MFVLSVLEAPNTKTNTLCVQTHLAINLFLILILIQSYLVFNRPNVLWQTLAQNIFIVHGIFFRFLVGRSSNVFKILRTFKVTFP